MKTKTEKDEQMMKVILSQEAVLCQIKFTLSAVNRLILFELWWKSYIDVECCQCHHFKSGSCFSRAILTLSIQNMHQLLWLLAWVLDIIFLFSLRGANRMAQSTAACKAIFNHLNQLSNIFQKLRIAAPLNGISRVSWANFTRFLLFTLKMPVIQTIFTGKHVKLLGISLETLTCGN